MSLFINNGLTGLLAAQTALQTIANNVANVNTEGYVRQEAQLSSNPIQQRGSFGIGAGVRVASIDRVYDQFLGDEVKFSTMAQSRVESFNGMATRLDGLLGNPDLNITASLQRFLEKLEAVNRDPTSTVNREQLLQEGDALENRFRQVEAQVSGLGNEINSRLRLSVDSINDIASSLATVNERIALASGGTPNELFDQQERLLNQLAEQIDFTQTRQANGTINVMVGSGQPLVLGQKSFSLAVAPNEFDGSKLELAYNNGSGLQPISSRISGGAVAGLLSFRDETLAATSRQLGQMALGLTETFNAQHRIGTDLNGQQGEDFFATLSPLATMSSRNTGTAAVTLSYGDVAAVNAKDYELLYDGAAWQLTDAITGGPVAMSGAGTVGDPFVAEGLEIVIGGAAAAGDRFLLQPVSQVAGEFTVEISDPSKIAVAALLSTSSALSNTGNGLLSDARIDDPAAPDLLQSVQIIFSDPATFRIYDSGGTDLSGPLTYTSGADISFNGWTVQINNAPQTGDEFSIQPGASGSGDNANGLIMGKVASNGYFSNGQISVEGLGAAMLTSVGSAAARSGQDLIVQNSLLNQAQLDFQSVSGVNLEEEAANLLRYQQAYQAASKIIGVANTLFQTLLNTVGR